MYSSYLKAIPLTWALIYIFSVLFNNYLLHQFIHHFLQEHSFQQTTKLSLCKTATMIKPPYLDPTSASFISPILIPHSLNSLHLGLCQTSPKLFTKVTHDQFSALIWLALASDTDVHSPLWLTFLLDFFDLHSWFFCHSCSFSPAS